MQVLIIINAITILKKNCCLLHLDSVSQSIGLAIFKHISFLLSLAMYFVLVLRKVYTLTIT